MKKVTPYMLNKARVPKQARGIKTKEKIIAAAAVLLSKKGYHNIDTPGIAAKAKVATGTFYSYFNNKREVFMEIMRRKYKKFDKKVFSVYIPKFHKNIADNHREVKKIIHYMVNGNYEEYKTDAHLLKEMLAMLLLDKEIAQKRKSEEKKIVGMLASYMQTYKKNLRISDYEASATLLYETMDHMIQQIKFNSTGISKKRLLREIEDMISRYLLD